jgi:hypothetical protein
MKGYVAVIEEAITGSWPGALSRSKRPSVPSGCWSGRTLYRGKELQ